MDLPNRKRIRLQEFDYSSKGAYFITFCTKERKPILSKIVGTGVPDGPKNILTDYGKIADKYINQLNDFYKNISVDKYVIMPNHIHLLIQLSKDEIVLENSDFGPSGTPVPTNSAISKFISTFKRFCNKEYGENIWQYRSHDHIIRNQKDYDKIWEYIDTNVLRWDKDCFYTEIM